MRRVVLAHHAGRVVIFIWATLEELPVEPGAGEAPITPDCEILGIVLGLLLCSVTQYFASPRY